MVKADRSVVLFGIHPVLLFKVARVNNLNIPALWDTFYKKITFYDVFWVHKQKIFGPFSSITEYLIHFAGNFDSKMANTNFSFNYGKLLRKIDITL